jgi:hypothetical protein
VHGQSAAKEYGEVFGGGAYAAFYPFEAEGYATTASLNGLGASLNGLGASLNGLGVGLMNRGRDLNL